ncbi:MAG: hypothetical protein WA418_30305 [Bradyrhizobium sp.]
MRPQQAGSPSYAQAREILATVEKLHARKANRERRRYDVSACIEAETGHLDQIAALNLQEARRKFRDGHVFPQPETNQDC